MVPVSSTHSSLTVLAASGTDCHGKVGAGGPGSPLLAGTCMDKLSPEPRARLQNRIPEDSAGYCRGLKENPQGPPLALGNKEEKKPF